MTLGPVFLLQMSLLGLLSETSKDHSGPVMNKLNPYPSTLFLCFPTHTMTFPINAQSIVQSFEGKFLVMIKLNTWNSDNAHNKTEVRTL